MRCKIFHAAISKAGTAHLHSIVYGLSICRNDGGYVKAPDDTMPSGAFTLYGQHRCLNPLLFRSLLYEVHELVELRCDDNLCAAVALLAHLCVVGSDRIVLSTSTGSESLGVNTVFCL